MRELDAIFGEIRSAASTPPSLGTWEAMCENVTSALAMDSARALDELLPMVTGLADHWPDAQRVLPTLWLWRWMDGGVEDSVVALGRVLRVVGQSLSSQELARVPELFDRMRATRLHVSQTRVDEVGVWDGAASLERLTHLTLHENCITDDLERWLTQQRLPHLTHLDLSGMLTNTDNFERWHQTSWMTQITHFSLGFSRLPTPDLEGFLRILPGTLESLSLDYNTLDTTIVRELAHSDRFSSLRHLTLSNGSLEDSAVHLLASTQTLGALETLDLSHNAITTQGLEPLLHAQTLLTGLRELNLRFNKLDGGLQPLGACRHIQALERLDVSYNEDAQGLLHGLAAQPTSQLHDLNLQISDFRPQECEDFAAHATLKLRVLGLGLAAHLGRWSNVAALLDAPACTNLEEINLNGLHFDDDGVAHLLASSSDAPLRSLSVNSARMSEAGLGALLRHERMARLELLNLRHASWSPSHGERLRTAPCAATLRELDLSATQLKGGLHALLQGTEWRSLESLVLHQNALSDEDAFHLARASMPRLRELTLWDNEISSAGLEALLRAPWFARLRHLNIQDNALTDAPLLDVIRAPCSLEILSISGKNLGDQYVASLATTPHLPHLQTMNLDRHLPLHTDTILSISQSPNLRRLTKLTLRVQDPEHRRTLHASSTLSRGVRQDYA